MNEKSRHWGSTLDAFPNEEGIYEIAKVETVTRVISWQIAEEMRKKALSRTRMAEPMHTSRAQVDRIFPYTLFCRSGRRVTGCPGA